MKKIKITTVRECLADLLELPGDLSYHGCIITLIGEREILLENYRSILEYRSDHLLVLTANGRIRIQGVSLSVLYYTELDRSHLFCMKSDCDDREVRSWIL